MTVCVTVCDCACGVCGGGGCALQFVDSQDLLFPPSRRVWNETAVLLALAALTPDNVIIFQFSSEFDSSTLDKTEPIYGMVLLQGGRGACACVFEHFSDPTPVAIRPYDRYAIQ